MTTSSGDHLLQRIQTLRVASRHARRSPHKPLLLLLAIGRHLNGHGGPAMFGEIEGELNGLIRRYGLPNSRENAHYPFWHLQNDELWEIDKPELVGTSASGDAYITDLREHNIRGGLVDDFIRALDASPDYAWRAVRILLNDYFPPSLHEDILEDVGLADKVGQSWLIDTMPRQPLRDPRFRDLVLQAYKSRCALCKLDVQVDGQPIGIEAAHIKWHCARGPAQVENGMALCALHHKFFDSGLFTVMSDLTVLVCGGLAVGDSVDESLNKFGGSALAIIPDCTDQWPGPSYLKWHRQAVFRASSTG